MKTLTALLLLISIVSAQPKELTKPQAIKVIQSYYANFKTGSYEYATNDKFHKKEDVKKYQQYTGNYKVKMEGCTCKISFDEISWPQDCTTQIDYDIYNWENAKMKDRKTIAFNLNEIDSIGNGTRELGENGVINWNMRFYSSKNIKIKTIPVIKDSFLGATKQRVELKINPESKETNSFMDIEIVKAFRRLVQLCISKPNAK